MGRSGVEFEVDGEAGTAGLEVKRAKKASMSVSWGCRLGGKRGEGRDLGDASGTLLKEKSRNPSTYLSTSNCDGEATPSVLRRDNNNC